MPGIHDGEGARPAPLDAFFESYYRLRPANATFTGLHDHDHRLPDWSAQGVEAMRSQMRGLRDAFSREGASRVSVAERSGERSSSGEPGASAERSDAAPDRWEALDVSLADSFLEIQIAELSGRHFQRGNPSLVIGEALFSIIALMIRDFAPLAQRARMARARLAALPRFLATALAVLAEAPLPSAWVEKALREVEGGRWLLGEGLDRWRAQDGMPDELREALRREGDAASGAVEAFAAELAALPRTTASAAAVGAEFLDLLVRRGHWVDRPLADLLAEARAHFADARALLDSMARALDPGGVPAVMERLALQHPPAAGYYRAFEETWAACHARAAALGLVTWGDAPIRYVPIPEWTRGAAASLYYLFYRSPAPLDPLAPHDYVVTPIEGLQGDALRAHLRAWNDSVIKLNHVVHHGALGHHVQNWHAARAPSRIGQVAAVDCASRIGMFLGGTMAEGWACYATDLMDDAGFLAPDERVAEQQSRVRMLARAIVDIEFHTGQRSFEDAVSFYEATVGMPRAAARAETVKNSMFPGTALMYWLGTSQIHALRAVESRRLGAAFSLRAFHDALLFLGSIPVALAGTLLPSLHASQPT